MENKIKFHVKRSYKGLVSVRSTIIELAKRKNLPIEITCSDFPDEKMTIFADQPPQDRTGPIKSKINDGEEYYLYDYIFEND